VRKTTGFSGELLVSLESPLPFPTEKLQFLLVELEDGIIPFHIRELEQLASGMISVSLTDVRTVEQAKKLNGCPVYLEKKYLESGETALRHLEDLSGYQVMDLNDGLLGVITEVLRWPGQDLLKIVSGEREILVPLTEEYITGLQEEKKILHVSLPEGLLDLNQ